MRAEKQYKLKIINNNYILYDDRIISDPCIDLFDTEQHQGNDKKSGSLSNQQTGIGRARVVYFSHDRIKMVLKHYYRGGFIANVIKDRYLGFNTENTRAFREWRLLKKMRDYNLPVPEAVAARVKKGLLFYRADLITQEIEKARTLSDIISSKHIDRDVWHKIGACIKAFHQKDIYHADLNARNIMLDEIGKIHLIDFDNSYIRSGSETWKRSNLARLKRSLIKFKSNESSFYFEDADWSALIEGYR